MKIFIFFFAAFCFASSLAGVIPDKIEPIADPIINKEIDHIQSKRDILVVETPTVVDQEIIPDEPIITEKIIETENPILNDEVLVETLPLIEERPEQPILLEREVIRLEEPLSDERIEVLPNMPYFNPMRTMFNLYDRELVPIEMRFRDPRMRFMNRQLSSEMLELELEENREPLILETMEPLEMYPETLPLVPSLTQSVLDIW